MRTLGVTVPLDELEAIAFAHPGSQIHVHTTPGGRCDYADLVLDDVYLVAWLPKGTDS